MSSGKFDFFSQVVIPCSMRDGAHGFIILCSCDSSTGLTT
jgi:hypothetical protein